MTELYPSLSVINSAGDIVVYSVAAASGSLLLVFSMVIVVVTIYCVFLKCKKNKRKYEYA